MNSWHLADGDKLH